MNQSLYQTPEFFRGVVEDVLDPKKLGRVRVRVFGIHSEKKARTHTSGIATNELPWASVGQPVTSAALNGIGKSPEILAGTWVYGYTLDGPAFQDLLITGTLPGIPYEVANKQQGFSDPSGTYPKEDHIGESDINRLARNENIDKTVVEMKKIDRDKGVPTASGSEWDEPETPYAAEYPKNHVYESESGHIKEVDDTPGAERTHEYHTSGTFKEVYPDGTKVEKIIGSDYEIIAADKKVYIKGDCTVTILGNAEVYVEGNAITVVKGNEERTIKGDINETVNGNVTRKVGGNVTETTGGSKTSETSGEDTIKASILHLNP
ncbi:MAG: hypothetical protein KAS32_20775 [Candidatus Peribacteraceae bacterium]|nr:hypothetical protein [Candidatus Peribacteraceae bacterium]